MTEPTTITLPESFSVTGSDVTITIDPNAWEDAQAHVEYLLPYAMGVILQRASAGKKDDAEKAQKAVEAAIERLQKGTVPAGGGFTKLTPEQYAMKETLAANKVKFEKGETIEACLVRLATKLTEGDDPEAIETTRETLQAELEASEVYKTALKARKSKTKTAKASGLIGKL